MASEEDGLFKQGMGFLNENADGITAGVGLGKGFYDIWSGLYGPVSHTQEVQRQLWEDQSKLAKQQIKSNKQAMADRKQFNTTWANASNGLAAKYAQPTGVV